MARWSLRIVPIVLLAFPLPALADEVAIAPFLAKPGVDPKVANNITSMVASEFDFNAAYESATQLDAAPSGYTLTCLGQVSCLSGVAKSAGKDHFVAGSVGLAGAEYELTMILVDGKSGAMIRKKVFKAPTATDRLADSIGGYVDELVTGQSKAAAAAEETVSDAAFDMYGAEEDDEFEVAPKGSIQTPKVSTNDLEDAEDPEDTAAAAAAKKKAEADAAAKKKAEADAAAAAAKKKAEADAAAAAKKKEEEAAAAAAKKKAEADAAAAAKKKAEADAAAAAKKTPPPSDELDDIEFGSVDAEDVEVDISDISFGDASDSVDVVESEELPEDDFDTPPAKSSSSSSKSSSSSSSSSSKPSSSKPSSSSKSSSSSSSSSRDLDELDEEEDLDDLDAPRPSSSSSKSKSPSGPSADAEIRGTVGENDPRMGVTLRGGVSKFQSFNFLTYGAELAIPVSETMFVQVGLEGFSTEREIPPALQEQFDGQTTMWQTVMPFNFGFAYQNTGRPFRPYVGGDLTLTPYTEDFKVAPGLRVRTGADYMLADSFGLNANVSAGIWYGAEFPSVQKDLQPLGVVPQFSVGTVVKF